MQTTSIKLSVSTGATVYRSHAAAPYVSQIAACRVLHSYCGLRRGERHGALTPLQAPLCLHTGATRQRGRRLVVHALFEKL